MVRKNIEMEQSLTEKQGVANFLRRSFEAVEESFKAAGAEDIEKAVGFPGTQVTARRLYLRVLAHSHEHMGQAVAYVRARGMRVPWPDPLREYTSGP